MKVSVIIPTYNGAHKLSNLLDALLGQSYSDFEVVVVVDGSTDNTLEVLNRYEQKFSHLKTLIQDNQGRSKVRNRGVEHSTGDLLIFYDDDMVPFPDSVKRHLQFHENHHGLCAGTKPTYPKRG
jgi:glycosyltransferase involved in cell wall biosynthesis